MAGERVGIDRVRVPLRVRVTPSAGGRLPISTVRRSVADAVERTCRALPWDTWGMDAASLASATFNDGARMTHPSALEEAALAGVREGAERAGIRPAPAPPAAQPRGEPVEAFDPGRVRWHPTGMTYVVPFFDGGTTEVPLRDETVRVHPRIPGPDEVLTVQEALDLAWQWHLHRRRGPDIDREKPGYWGFIRTTDRVLWGYVVILDVRALGGNGELVRGAFTYLLDEYLDTGDDAMTIGTIYARTPTSPGGWVGYAYGSWGHPDAQVGIAFVVQAAPSRAGGHGAGGRSVAGRGGSIVPPTPRGDGSAGPAGTGGTGVADPVSEGAERAAERRTEGALPHARWPSAPGATTAPLVCEPFLMEPTSDRLINGRGLESRMRHLAADLDIPECAYLATFALHCARAIAGRARGLAAVAIASDERSRVTVTPECSGNHGYVDVQPGASRAMDDLLHLARLAVQVGGFVDDVVSEYDRPGNRALVGTSEDSGPNYGFWLMYFSRQFEPALRYGFETVFSEACRCLLLQQLRSSRAAIEARQSAQHFAATVDDLRDKLETIGRVVLWPTVLLQAIEHSASVFVTGTVRDVLSEPESISDLEGHVTTFPPPLGSVPEPILAIVGDSRIERRDGRRVAVHNGREWTEEQLRSTINDRRRLLNMTDPLFLQIENLSAVAANSARDPGYLERFVRDLLADMHSANRRMLEDTADLDDGAQFAVEASQYIRREGGRDWRGLRYELQGIHALADRELSSAVGSVWRYANGVNDALAHRESRDVLLTIASTAGIIVLGLLCAPLGAVAAAAITGAAGLAFTIHDVLDARTRTDLYRALDDPELLQSWQDVQLAQLMAGIGIAFSIFDVLAVGRGARLIAREAAAALRVAERTGLREAARLAAAETRAAVARRMTEEFLANAARHAMTEAVVMAAITAVLPRVVAPALVPWIRRQAQEHGTLPQTDAALGALATGAAR